MHKNNKNKTSSRAGTFAHYKSGVSPPFQAKQKALGNLSLLGNSNCCDFVETLLPAYLATTQRNQTNTKRENNHNDPSFQQPLNRKPTHPHLYTHTMSSPRSERERFVIKESQAIPKAPPSLWPPKKKEPVGRTPSSTNNSVLASTEALLSSDHRRSKDYDVEKGEQGSETFQEEPEGDDSRSRRKRSKSANKQQQQQQEEGEGDALTKSSASKKKKKKKKKKKAEEDGISSPKKSKKGKSEDHDSNKRLLSDSKLSSTSTNKSSKNNPSQSSLSNNQKLSGRSSNNDDNYYSPQHKTSIGLTSQHRHVRNERRQLICILTFCACLVILLAGMAGAILGMIIFGDKLDDSTPAPSISQQPSPAPSLSWAPTIVPTTRVIQ